MADPLERLYAAFAEQPRPRVIEACPHCRDPAEFQALLHVPLRELDDDLLGSFVMHAGTVGTDADRHWLAPRLIELVVTGQARYCGIEPTLGALARAGWATWPVQQRGAAMEVLDDFWARTLAAPPAGDSADAVLCGLTVLVPDPSTLLDRLTPPAGRAATLHLRDIVDTNAGTVIAKRRLTSPYWTPGSHDRVVEWLCSPRLADAVVAAAAGATDPVEVEALDEIDRYLTAFR